MRHRAARWFCALTAAGWLPAAVFAAQGVAADAAQPAPAAMDMPLSLRLSPSQYRQSIADIFGASIKITGRFEPETRDQGLLQVGARTTNLSDSGLERYDSLARGIAAQVVDPQHRATLLECRPRSEQQSDAACARAIFTRIGRLLYRRPLTEEELQANVQAAGAAADQLQDFYRGISATLAQMLVSPEFLFRFKVTEPDPEHPGHERLDGYSKAAELSFFLWNTTPDERLLQAAERGDIHTPKGLGRQVDRLLASPRLEDGVRAFFADMLGFSDFESLAKDPTFFPAYTAKAKEDAQEQTLRTIVDHLISRQGDYRDLFTTPRTYMTRSLAALYAVPLADSTDNGQPERWFEYTYPAGDPRAGILSEASFTTLFSPSGRTSPTLRGKALREHLMCQRVPPPPGNVSFKFVEDVTNPNLRTTRDRLSAHRSEAMCAGCHRLTDPIGLALENFDSGGSYRTQENGTPIDAGGELNGHRFEGSQGLGRTVHDDPAVTTCVATRAFAFETGYVLPKEDPRWSQIMRKFADSHYNFVELVRQLALSDLSYTLPTRSPQSVATR